MTPPTILPYRFSALTVPAHLHALIWFLLVTVLLAAAYVCYDLRLLTKIYIADRSHLTSVIALLLVVATVFAAWHIVRVSRQIEKAGFFLHNPGAWQQYSATCRSTTCGLVADFMHEIAASDDQSKALPIGDRQDAIVEFHAARIRNPVELGWFLADLSIRLGLAGTIIGFIFIFTSLSGMSVDGSEGLSQLLITMSGGMGTSLYTTLCGLVGATVLSAQFMVLGRQAEHLTGMLIRLAMQQNKQPTRTENVGG